ncbi:TPA: DUF3316 domain-containing protein [Photobacterium damselae]|uniref:DUF3316 domain-containing protein n=1 Tax=Photobacterium damselae TaxID=38293 RepID=UPI000D0733D4|nr:DUF3316 domain-containing protein [Photobacterium damselae]PSB77092.1 hypothetical protein C5F61_13145 [Photobacterium damselae subsp. damselae]
MVKLISLLSGIVLSFAVNASPYTWKSQQTTIDGAQFTSSQQAFDAGLVLLRGFESKSAFELGKALNPISTDRVNPRSYQITQSKVKVDQFLNSQGDMIYQPIVDITYRYEARDRNN